MLTPFDLLLVCGITVQGLPIASTNEDFGKRLIFTDQHCTEPPSVSNGRFNCKVRPLTVGRHCKLSCSTGYKPSNSYTTITCSTSLRWTKSATCQAIQCPEPHDVKNGQYKCPKDQHWLNQVCHLQCNPGFKHSSSSTDIRCLSSETWSSPGHCVAMKCPYPADISHGIYLCSNKWPLYPHDVCSLRCDTGFRPRSSLTSIYCLNNETWSSSTDCVEVQCPVRTVAHGQLTCNGTVPYTRLDTCKLTCDRGFKAINPIAGCLQNERWAHNQTCEEIICPSLPNLPNGTFYCRNISTHKMDDICDLQCGVGFKPNTHITHTKCLSTGQWSMFASCVEIKCSPLPNVTNGHFYCATSGSYKLDDICDLQCDSGFKPRSHITHTQCLSTGLWSQASSCVEIICPDPKPIANGRFICNNPSPLKQNALCQLQCYHGYKSSDLLPMVCLSSSTWSSHASCKEMKCYAPPIVSHGHYKCGNSTSYKIDTVCPLQCDQGYKPSSHSHISCVDEDDWSASGTCEEIQCQEPPKVDNGQYHCSNNTVHTVDEVCHLQCNNGYGISSNSSAIHCLNNGSWSTSTSCNEILCLDPPKVDHGSYVCRDQGAQKLNDACQLHCDEGFKPIEGGHTIYCQMDSTWNKPSTCNKKECDAPPVIEHGRIACTATVYSISTACQLQCDPGYKPSSLSNLLFCLEDETWTPVSCVAH